MTSTHVKPLAPSPWVMMCCQEIPAGATVLDLACGQGRHAIYLRDHGYSVTALDRDITAVQDIGGIEVIEADLENNNSWPLGNRMFDAVVVVNYLHRPLFSSLLSAVKRGGVLIYETFMEGQQAYGRPTNPDFLLQSGELKRVIGEAFDIIQFEEGYASEPTPNVKQRICACRIV